MKMILAILLLASVASADYVSAKRGTGFSAPTINDKDNVSDPATGELVFDTSDDTFYGNVGTPSSPTWAVLSNVNTYVPDFISQTSSPKTSTGSGKWLQMSGNSVTLSGGKWRLSGTCRFYFQTSQPNYSQVMCAWKGANGDDTTTTPSDVTIQAGLHYHLINFEPYSVRNYSMNAPEVRIDASSSAVTVYLDSNIEAGTPANTVITNYIYAEKVYN